MLLPQTTAGSKQLLIINYNVLTCNPFLKSDNLHPARACSRQFSFFHSSIFCCFFCFIQIAFERNISTKLVRSLFTKTILLIIRKEPSEHIGDDNEYKRKTSQKQETVNVKRIKLLIYCNF